jgi:hypothetical protein
MRKIMEKCLKWDKNIAQFRGGYKIFDSQMIMKGLIRSGKLSNVETARFVPTIPWYPTEREICRKIFFQMFDFQENSDSQKFNLFLPIIIFLKIKKFFPNGDRTWRDQRYLTCQIGKCLLYPQAMKNF